MAPPKMELSIERINAELRLSFNPPALKLASRVGPFLEIAYRKLRLRYDVALSDLQGMTGQTMQDVGARITLFSGELVTAIQPGLLNARLSNITSDEELQKSIDALELIKASLFECVADAEDQVGVGAIQLEAAIWLSTEDESVTKSTIRDALNSLAPSVVSKVAPERDFRFCPHYAYDMREQGHYVELMMQESAINDRGVFLHLKLNASNAADFKSLDAISLSARAFVEQALAHIDARLPAKETA